MIALSLERVGVPLWHAPCGAGEGLVELVSIFSEDSDLVMVGGVGLSGSCSLLITEEYLAHFGGEEQVVSSGWQLRVRS